MDVSEIVYIVRDAQEFWSEIEDMLRIADDCTLDQLDNTLRRFISFCAAYHERYLQSPLQLGHACDMASKSDLFAYHSKRMWPQLVKDAQTNTDPHVQMIMYNVMLACGRSNTSFLRSQELWQPLLSWLMDHVRLEVDPDVEYGFHGAASGSSSGVRAVAVPIEAKLRFSSVKLLYEVCRFQHMSLSALDIFDDFFIDYLFDLVEQTRQILDESFNYSVIKLIVALNERFMVAALPSHMPHSPQPHTSGFANQQFDSPLPESTNRVLRVLTSRHGSSPTFGVNLIFMLNRADRTPEDLCMQLLVLKFLYVLFNTKTMAEYFYTNDLCVLVDVFLREIVDIDEDNESLRHTYLRVLHPLLTKTQLRIVEYKRPQLVHMLECLVANESIRDVNPTTKRLVERCMSGSWCIPFRTPSPSTPRGRALTYDESIRRGESPAAVSTAQAPRSAGPHGSDALQAEVRRRESVRGMHPKASRSAEHVPLPSSSSTPNKQRAVSGQHHHTYARSNGRARTESKATPRLDSGDFLPCVATANAPESVSAKHRTREASFDVGAAAAGFSALSLDSRATRIQNHPGSSTAPLTAPVVVAMVGESLPPLIRVSPTPLSTAHKGRSVPTPPSSESSYESASPSSTSTTASRRRPPPPPPDSSRRRKPPAIPLKQAKLGVNGGPLNVMATSSQPNLLQFSGMKTS